MIRNSYKNIYFLLIIFFISLGIFHNVNAVELYLKSSQNSYFPNEIFQTEIRLNVNPSENVTAIEGKIQYNCQDLKAIEFLTGNSILTFVDQPTIDVNQGLISFSGIIPGGYTGRLPGDPGESNLLGTIIFQALKTKNNQTTIQIDSNSRIFVEDGQELKSNLNFRSLILNINDKEAVFNPLNELKLSQELDKTPPEQFTPQIIQINNEYFIIFNTQDKQSGIDHYDLNILTKNIWGKFKIIKTIQNIQSPYPISIKDIQKPLQIVAVDKAGNQRAELLSPVVEAKWYQNYFVWGIIIILIMITFLSYYFIRRKIIR